MPNRFFLRIRGSPPKKSCKASKNLVRSSTTEVSKSAPQVYEVSAAEKEEEKKEEVHVLFSRPPPAPAEQRGPLGHFRTQVRGNGVEVAHWRSGDSLVLGTSLAVLGGPMRRCSGARWAIDAHIVVHAAPAVEWFHHAPAFARGSEVQRRRRQRVR